MIESVKFLAGMTEKIAVLAGAAGADETMLGALVAFDLGILERGPSVSSPGSGRRISE